MFFDIDRWQEIYQTLSRHKLRTALTGFGVFWGILMLVLLLGAGKGLQNGIEFQFRGDATNSMWVFPGQTSIPHAGLGVNRSVTLTTQDVAMLRLGMGDKAEYIVPRQHLTGEFTVRKGTKYASFEVLFTEPDYKNIRLNKYYQGRFLNEADMKEARKVAVIGIEVYKSLFDAKNNEIAVGKYINIKGTEYVVIGVFDNPNNQADREKRRIYVPYSTGQLVYNYGNRVRIIPMTTTAKTLEEAKAAEERVRMLLAREHKFSVNDKEALQIGNNMEEFQDLQRLFTGIRVFVWFVGISTLLAGIIGISNIMMIIVKERTKEIGVRKAMGATPWSIVSMILQESILITGLAGYIGLVLGVGILEAISRAIGVEGGENGFFMNPEIDLQVAIYSTLILVFSGALAGFFPAWRAARVHPIEALRAD